jgi:hypothetical protein
MGEGKLNAIKWNGCITSFQIRSVQKSCLSDLLSEVENNENMKNALYTKDKVEKQFRSNNGENDGNYYVFDFW